MLRNNQMSATDVMNLDVIQYLILLRAICMDNFSWKYVCISNIHHFSKIHEWLKFKTLHIFLQRRCVSWFTNIHHYVLKKAYIFPQWSEFHREEFYVYTVNCRSHPPNIVCAQHLLWRPSIAFAWINIILLYTSRMLAYICKRTQSFGNTHSHNYKN